MEQRLESCPDNSDISMLVVILHGLFLLPTNIAPFEGQGNSFKRMLLDIWVDCIRLALHLVTSGRSVLDEIPYGGEGLFMCTYMVANSTR